MAAAYASQVILARVLGQDQYGAFTYGYSWALILSIVAALGLPSAALRFLPQYEVQGKWDYLRGALFGHNLIVLFTSSLITVIAHLALMTTIFSELDPQLRSALIAAVYLVPPLALVSVEGEQCRALGRIAAAYIPNNLLRPLALIVAMAPLAMGCTSPQSTSALASASIAFVTVAVVQHFWKRRVVASRLPKSQSLRTYEWRLWIRVALPLMLISGFFVLLERIDILMLGSLADPRSIGTYSAASRTATLISFFFVAINAALLPRLSRLFSMNERGEMQRLLHLASKWCFFPSLVLYCSFLVFGEVILSLFGPDFASVAFIPLIVLATGYLVSASAGPVGHILNITGHHNKSLAIYSGAMIINVGLNALLIPPYGVTGAALATTASMISWNIAQFTICWRVLGLSASFLVPSRRHLGHQS